MPPKARVPEGTKRNTAEEKKRARAPRPGANKTAWWYDAPRDSADAGGLAGSLFGYVDDLKKNSAYRLQADLDNLRLYGAPSSGPYFGGSWARQIPADWFGAGRKQVTISLMKACVDTLKSKMSTDEPRPMFITDGGDYTAQTLAKQLQAFTDGVFYETRAYELALDAFLDAAIFGTGVLFPYIDDCGRLALERVFPYELFVDDADGLYGAPRNMYRVKFVDRDRLAALYPSQKELIESAQGLKLEDGASAVQRTNLVQVVEAWHLPSADGEEDGRHTIAVSNATLLDERYEENEHAFVILRFMKKQVGFLGQGLGETIAPIQNELNTLLWKIQVCMHFLSIPHWLKPTAGMIRFGAFNNQIGSVIEYAGGLKPELMVTNAVPPEIIQHANWLYQKGFEQAGISMMEAQSSVPGYGTMSGAAVREVRDTASDRFKSVAKGWGQFHLDLATKMVRLAAKYAEQMVDPKTGDAIASIEGGKAADRKAASEREAEGTGDTRGPGRPAGKRRGYAVTVVMRSITGKATRLETIDWKDIQLKERKYQIQLQPVSKFASDIPGALQSGTELVQAGLMDPATFKDLMNFPDLKAAEDLEGSSRELAKKMVARILDDGDKAFMAPDPYMDLQYAVKYATLMLNHALADEMPEERVESLRTWISACDDLMEAAKAAEQIAAGGAGAPPGAVPPGAGGPGGPGGAGGAQMGAPPMPAGPQPGAGVPPMPPM